MKRFNTAEFAKQLNITVGQFYTFLNKGVFTKAQNKRKGNSGHQENIWPESLLDEFKNKSSEYQRGSSISEKDVKAQGRAKHLENSKADSEKRAAKLFNMFMSVSSQTNKSEKKNFC